MRWALAFVVVMPAVLLVLGAVRGQVRVRSCCSVDAAHDVRMSAAFASDPALAGGSARDRRAAVQPSAPAPDELLVRGDRAAS